MAITAPKKPLSKEIQAELLALSLRIKPAVAAKRLWERELSDRERQKLGGSLEKTWQEHGTVGMWMKLHRVSLGVAVIEVAYRLRFTDKRDRGRLLREIGEPSDGHNSVTGHAARHKSRSAKPRWNRETGELTLAGAVIRKVRIMKRPSNIQQILEAFERAGWPKQIANPLRDSSDQAQLHQTLRSLHTGLKAIRFSSTGGAAAINWSNC